MRKEKKFIINLNPSENKDTAYLNPRLLCNPFLNCAVRDLQNEMDASRHLLDGVPLKHVQWLLEMFLTSECAIKILPGMRPGQRWYVVVRATETGGEIIRRRIGRNEQEEFEKCRDI